MTSQSLTFLATVLLSASLPSAQAEPKNYTPCCTQCNNNPDVKYYSIPDVSPPKCGESCIDPAEYWKYKEFEWHLTKANSSTPCKDHGFPFYWFTETHGKDVNLTVNVDFYGETNRTDY
eukprot:TRINITY_DN964_c0_g1_i1.p1 TRINITY_DN964_c0_g1~~TRINITY_DN964_c0_g1_i1.p1  ORF type:complete len:119 (+),score=8.09 TRINITY_DN964_c0_g1_i1:52-408(+)